jgi:aconitate hydratase
MEAMTSVGATVLANACGPCIGQWRRDGMEQGKANSIVSSFNRNFPKRNDGNPGTLSFIGSPEMVAAYALSGSLSFNPMTDSLTAEDGSSFRLQPPAPAPDLPADGFIRDEKGFVHPPEDHGDVEVVIDPASKRLQKLEPFDPWDGQDYVELPLLIKAKGKCTTDHISPAGPWLRFRGHLNNISDNMLIGAVNAFTGETGRTRNLDSGETGLEPQQAARQYKAAGKRWVVVGDENYGEGSSREHAAMSPRLLGAAAVIVRSFARIHESNLKKQGVLPLTFTDPADYDKVRETDRVSILGLAGLAPGAPVAAVLHHEDGSRTELTLHHTLNQEQIDWFKAGSALNVLRKQTS